MVTKYFDFKDALDYMLAGDTVGLITDKERYYTYDEKEGFKATIAKSGFTYSINKFYVDSILSNDWFIVKES